MDCGKFCKVKVILYTVPVIHSHLCHWTITVFKKIIHGDWNKTIIDSPILSFHRENTWYQLQSRHSLCPVADRYTRADKIYIVRIGKNSRIQLNN